MQTTSRGIFCVLAKRDVFHKLHSHHVYSSVILPNITRVGLDCTFVFSRVRVMGKSRIEPEERRSHPKSSRFGTIVQKLWSCIGPWSRTNIEKVSSPTINNSSNRSSSFLLSSKSSEMGVFKDTESERGAALKTSNAKTMPVVFVKTDLLPTDKDSGELLVDIGAARRSISTKSADDRLSLPHSLHINTSRRSLHDLEIHLQAKKSYQRALEVSNSKLSCQLEILKYERLVSRLKRVNSVHDG